MFRGRSNGGWNKSHGTVEKTPRIDSFGLPASYQAESTGGPLFACMDGKIEPLDCAHYTEYGPEAERELVELWAGEWNQTIELSRKVNGLGGSQTYFLGPACGERRRYLYRAGSVFLCRKCSRLNYRSQQETRSDSMYYYNKGMALAEKHFDRWPLVRVDGFSFCRWMPDRPRYMHQTTYRRYLQRFTKYQRQHEKRLMEDMARLLNGPKRGR